MEPPRDLIPFASQVSKTPIGFGASNGACNTLGTLLLGAIITYFAPPVIGGLLEGVRDAFDKR